MPRVEWTEGDAENLTYPDASFDVVVSQFGHMFAPRPDVALSEMRRVLKPGGRSRLRPGRPSTSSGDSRSVGPIQKLVESLAGEPAKLSSFRAEFDALASPYYTDNVVRQDYLLTRAAAR